MHCAKERVFRVRLRHVGTSSVSESRPRLRKPLPIAWVSSQTSCVASERAEIMRIVAWTLVQLCAVRIRSA